MIAVFFCMKNAAIMYILFVNRLLRMREMCFGRKHTIKFQDGCTFCNEKYSHPVAQCCVVLLAENSLAKALLPGQLELPVVIGTVSQIEVD